MNTWDLIISLAIGAFPIAIIACFVMWFPIRDVGFDFWRIGWLTVWTLIWLILAGVGIGILIAIMASGNGNILKDKQFPDVLEFSFVSILVIVLFFLISTYRAGQDWSSSGGLWGHLSGQNVPRRASHVVATIILVVVLASSENLPIDTEIVSITWLVSKLVGIPIVLATMFVVYDQLQKKFQPMVSDRFSDLNHDLVGKLCNCSQESLLVEIRRRIDSERNPTKTRFISVILDEALDEPDDDIRKEKLAAYYVVAFNFNSAKRLLKQCKEST